MITVYENPNPLDAACRTIQRVEHWHAISVWDVLPKWARAEGVDVRVTRDGIEIPREDWALPIPDESRIEIVERPGFIFALAGLKGLALIGAALINAAATFAVSFAVSYLIGASRKPKQPGEQDSPTYTFSGIRSERASNGAAVPVVYGEHLVAGVEINKFTRVSLIGTELYVLLLLSEGPIESIGGKTTDGGPFTSQEGNLPAGMLINGQPAEDFDEVEVHVRLGGNDQTYIPGFANAEQIIDVGFDLEESATPGPGAVEITPKTGGYDPTDLGDAAILDLWDTVEVFTTDVEADEFGVILEFPTGLYTTNSGGIGPNTAEFQVRYRALDGGGSPTGNYVVLPPEPPISAAQPNKFAVEFRHPFYSASSFVADGPGERAEFDGVNDYVSVASPSGFPSVPVPNEQISVGLWLYCTSAYPTSNGTDSYVVAEQWGSNRGWRILLDLTLNSGNRSATFRVILGNGTTTLTKTFLANFSTNSAAWINEWHFFGFSFDNNEAGPLQSRYRRSYDGVTQGETVSILPERNDAATIYVGDSPSASEDPFKGYMDGFKVWGRELEVSDWAQQFNGGLGFNGDGDEPDLVLAWLFDSESGGETPDASPNGNDGTLSGATISSGGAGLIEGSLTGTIERGKYRVEVMRLDDQSTGLNSNNATWSQIRLTQFEQFQYPGRALMAVKIRADGQINGGQPEITVPVKGVRCPIWDGASEDAPTAPKIWSKNPAWVTLDAITNQTYGAGDYYSLTDVDLPAFQTWAAHCDEFTQDGRESRGGGATVDLSYSDPTVTIEISDVTDGIPVHWEVGGYIIVRSATDTSYNLADGYAMQIESLAYDAGLETLTIEATWPAGVTAPSAGPVSDATAEVIGAERRFEFDGVFDRRDGEAWDAILQIMQSARAVPIRRGSRLSVFVDRPSEPVGTVSMSNIIEGSLELSWIAQHDRVNTVSAEILDRDDKYRRVPLELEHPTATDPTTFTNLRRRAYSLEGVTRKSQAYRHLQRELNVHHLIRRGVRWAMPLDGVQFEPGDVVRFTHDMPGWAPSGLFRAGCTTTELILDRPIEVTGTFGMTIVLRGTGETIEFTDGDPTGSYAAGDTIELADALDYEPSEGDMWILTSEVPYQLVRIVEAVFDPQTLTRQFVGLSYAEAVYSDAYGDFLNAPSTLPVPGSGTAQLASLAPPPVRNLQASTRSHETTDGTLETRVELSWEPGTDGGQEVVAHEIFVWDQAKRLPVKWAEVSGSQYRATVPVEGLDPARTWRWKVRTVGRGGIRSRLALHSGTGWEAPTRDFPRRTAGTSAARSAVSSPRDGDRFYDRDIHQWTSYDSSRSAWLPDERHVAEFSSNASVAAVAGVLYNGDVGAIRFAYDVRILGWDLYTHVNSTCDVVIRDVTTAFDTLSLSSSRTASETALNYTLAAGNALSVQVTSGTASNSVAARVYYCKVI